MGTLEIGAFNRPPEVDNCGWIQSVKLYELMLKTVSLFTHLHHKEIKQTKKTCHVRNAYDSLFHEFIRRISQIYVHLKKL